MGIGMFTLNKSDMDVFEGLLPDEVRDNAGKPGYYVLAVTDDDFSILGMAQFYIGMMPDKTISAEVCYVYVKEGSRRQGLATKMIGKVHRILKQSGVGRSMVLVDKKNEAEAFFKENGYIFMKMDESTMAFSKKRRPDADADELQKLLSGVRFSER